MAKVFKFITAIALVFACVSLSFVGYAQFEIPNEIRVEKAENIKLNSFYTAKINSDDRQNADIMVFGIIPAKSARLTLSKRRYVVVSGDVFGIKLYTKGLIVTQVSKVKTEKDMVIPGEDAGLKNGDMIVSVNGKKVTRNSQLENAVKKSKGKIIKLVVKRNSEKFNLEIKPEIDKNDGVYRIGVWVRDSCAGIGTMTFYDRNTGAFAGLGHAVCDVDTGQLMPLSGGEAMEADINGCYKGTNGNPGELCGVFAGKSIGTLTENHTTGIYGKINEFDKNAQVMPVAQKQEVKEGAAQIVSTVDKKGPRYYNVEITKIYSSKDSLQKNMSVKITDERLIKKTGGIVQGMSGSPIIQNGMLVGAVTHVYVNDSLQGYGVFAENMVVEMDRLQKQAA